MKKFFKRFFVLIGILILSLALLAGYGYFIEPARLVVREKTLTVPNWNKDLDGFKIVIVSDIHAGSNYVNEERLQKITEEVNKQNADIVVNLGDNVSQSSGRRSLLKMPIETIAANISGMKAKYGVFAVIGNHDWWDDERKITAELQKSGFKVLENQTAEITVNNQIVTIAGFEDFWKHRGVTQGIQQALSEIENKSNVIALAHNPDSFDLMPNSISLQLSGHTHGGQVWIPFYGPPLTVAKREYSYGHIEKDGKNLYVTSGIGMSGPNFRIGVPPEIVVLTLKPE